MNIINNILLIVVIMLNFSCGDHDSSKRTSDCYIDDSEKAIKIAETNWVQIYGNEVLNEKPYLVTFKNDSICIVEGTLPENTLGGVAYIEIRLSDGKVLKVTHSK